MGRILALALALAAAWPGGGASAPPAGAQPASPSTAPAAEPWERAVAALLARRAAAVERGDERAFVRTMAGAPKSFARERLAWFRALRELPLATYVLEIDPNGFGDLAPALHRHATYDEVHGVEAIERIGLRGYDRRPTAERVYLTVGRRGARWSVIADDELDDLGLLSSRDVWDFGAVRTVERSGVMVVFHPGSEGDARRILSGTVAAVRRVDRAWPYDWPGRVVVIVPRTERELARILQTDFDLGPFVAFASSSVDRRRGWALAGHRVYVQPATYFRQSEGLRADILSHEVLHIATRDLASPFTPTWLDEGVAQLYGEEGAAATGDLRALVRRAGGLPDDALYVAGSGSEIRAAYGAAYDFAAGLARRGGAARLYRALGRRDPLSQGTWRYHLDRAAREAFGISFRRLERDWTERIL